MVKRSRFFAGISLLIAAIIVSCSMFETPVRDNTNDPGSSEYTGGGTDNTDPITVQAPTALTASSVTHNSVQLSWTDNSDNETAFELQRKTGSGDYTDVATDISADETGCTDSGLSASTTYTYRIRAAAGTSVSDWVESSAVTTAAGAFTEENVASASASDYHGSDGSYNRGMGQMVRFGQDYKPETFSIWIHDSMPYADNNGLGTVTGAALRLMIWDASGTASDGELLCSSDLEVPAGTTGEITFEINFDGAAIGADTRILYAVYIRDALALDIRGKLVYDSSGANYNDTDDDDIDIFRTSIGCTDEAVSDYSEWSILSNNDLKFSLTGYTY